MDHEHHIDPSSFTLGLTLQRVLHSQGTIMATLTDISTQLDSLQAAVDADRAQDTSTAAALQAEIDRLTALTAGSVTVADLDGIMTRLAAIQASLQGP